MADSRDDAEPKGPSAPAGASGRDARKPARRKVVKASPEPPEEDDLPPPRGEDPPLPEDDEPHDILSELGRDLRAATYALTGLRADPAIAPGAADIARSRRVFPVVALALGVLVAACYWTLQSVQLYSLVAATATIGLLILLTGARGEIGLAHFLEGVVRGKTAAARHKAIEVGHVGYPGFLVILLSILLRVVILAAATAPHEAAAVIIAAVVLSRTALVLASTMSSPEETDATGGLLREEGRDRLWIAIAAGALLALVFLWSWGAFLVLGAVLLATLFGVWIAKSIGGGLNWPGLAMIQQFAEVTALTIAIAKL